VVSPGERVALLGENGSGKSTALHTLLHFVTCSAGRAELGGVPVAAMRRAGIARHLGWVPGETHLFATTLGDNLRLADPDASDRRCVEVLTRVGLGEWFEGLREGLATRLGSGGRPLSAGERQRLGLARALLGPGSVLVMDEPTAHLDASGARGCLVELLDAADGRAVVLVSHDHTVADLVDRVVTLPRREPPTG
jgi:ABC-type transport system involved in cytochrome bd biosynthesis fused ATPase/permease subunit